MYTIPEYKYDDFIMDTLKKLNYKISREAVFIMLEDGILTEETDFEAYFIAKKLKDTKKILLNNDLNKAINYLRIGFTTKVADDLEYLLREFLKTLN